MNYRGVYITIFCCIIIVLNSCNQDKDTVSVCYKQFFPVDTVVPVQEYDVEESARLPRIFRLKNRLLVFGDYSKVSIYS